SRNRATSLECSRRWWARRPGHGSGGTGLEPFDAPPILDPRYPADETAPCAGPSGPTYHVGMSRPSNKDKILTDGLRLVHARGFGASSVRDITQAAGVPQGSFTNHFASKEAFGLEVLERYREMTSAGV